MEFCEATHIGLVDELMESCTGGRQTETCAAPRHVDAPRDFYFIYSERATWEVGVRCQTFSLVVFSRFSRPRAGLATVLSSFFGLATNTLFGNVRTKNNKNHE